MDLRPETPADSQAIRRLLTAAFESSAEADLADEIRSAGLTEISLVVEIDGQIVGHAVFSEVQIEMDGPAPRIISLAPMAVLPGFQRQGIGSRLVDAGLQRVIADGWDVVVVLGHPEYYSRFGFSADSAENLVNPFGAGPFWMARELRAGALDGVAGTIQYPEPFRKFE